MNMSVSVGIDDTQGKGELARDQYQAAVRQDKKHLRAWTRLGDSTFRLKEYKAAEKAYGKALDLDPKNGDLHNNLAWVYVQQDRMLSKAQDLVVTAMELTPDHRPDYLDTLGRHSAEARKVPGRDRFAPGIDGDPPPGPAGRPCRSLSASGGRVPGCG